MCFQLVLSRYFSYVLCIPNILNFNPAEGEYIDIKSYLLGVLFSETEVSSFLDNQVRMPELIPSHPNNKSGQNFLLVPLEDPRDFSLESTDMLTIPSFTWISL